MALNFPANPSIGDEFEQWVWGGTSWLTIQGLQAGLPAGSIIQWGGISAPTNWLMCDGSAVSRTIYSSLFAAIGTMYGAGDGTTTFNLPDLRGRVPVGKNGGSFGTLGATGGVESVALTIDQMPSHTHIQDSHNHTQNAHNHTHRQWIFNGAGASGTHYGFGYASGTGAANDTTSATSSGEVWYGNYPATATNNPTTATNQNTGGGQAHTNLQPYQVVNYIIKTTAATTPGESELATRVQPVILGGTGATSLAAGQYVKGNGTSTVTTQAGVPATDLTGTISSDRLPSIPKSLLPAGTVLQVLSKSDGVDYSAGVSTNTWITWPGNRLQLAITPQSSTSKILVIVNADLGNISNDAAFRIMRNGTAIGVGGSYSGKQQASGVTGMLYASDSNHTRRVVTVSYLDAPATTSATTYDIQFSSEGGTMYLNRAPATSYQNGTYIFAATGMSTITLMEVAG